MALVTQRVRAPLTHASMIQEVVAGALPDGRAADDNTGFTGFPDGECLAIEMRPGAANDTATFDTVALSPVPDSVEGKLAIVPADALVRVFVAPPVDAAYEVGNPAGEALFEGVVVRRPFALGSINGRDAEELSVVATWTPGLDNRHPDHLVRGRWFFDLGADAPQEGEPNAPAVTLEDPGVPAAFNFRGRPNRDGDDARLMTAGAPAAGGVALTAAPFTHDHDPAGRLWTVGDALRSLLVRLLYGDDAAAPLTRHVAVEAATAAALMAETLDASTDPRGRFEGLDAVLAETDVTGLGVLDAVEAVCNAGGFRLTVSPAAFPDEWGGGDSGSGGRPDRVYQLSIARVGVGRALVSLLLPKRGAFAE
ncbi:MAG: hypothetical protein AAFY08_16170, partial [Planctomycetota bacterium]